MDFFKKLTQFSTGNPLLSVDGKLPVVIMGRKTWESIPVKFRPLPGRFNIILTQNKHYNIDSNNTKVVQSIEEALQFIDNHKELSESFVYVIGGGQIYAKVIQDCQKIYLTKINGDYDCDTFFPELAEYGFHVSPEMDKELNWALPRKRVENNVEYEFMVYEKVDNKENQK